MMSSNVVVDSVAIAIMMVVAVIISIFVFFSGYTFKEDIIVVNFGFMPIKVKYDDILLVRTNSDKTKLALFIETNEENADVKDEANNLKANAMLIFVSPSNVDNFISNIKKVNLQVPIEIVTEEKNQKW